MKVLVSACLLGDNCKYDGGNNRNESVIKFVAGHKVVPVCPEVLGGLPTPREPSELIGNRVINKDGISVDEQFRTGAKEALTIALENEVDMAILQSRSPSCGVNEVYDGTFTETLIPGRGIFAQMLDDAGIKVIDASFIAGALAGPFFINP